MIWKGVNEGSWPQFSLCKAQCRLELVQKGSSHAEVSRAC